MTLTSSHFAWCPTVTDFSAECECGGKKAEPKSYVTVTLDQECECSEPHRNHGSFIWAGAGEPVKHVVTTAVIHEERKDNVG